jgi:hypothetical protein
VPPGLFEDVPRRGFSRLLGDRLGPFEPSDDLLRPGVLLGLILLRLLLYGRLGGRFRRP